MGGKMDRVSPSASSSERLAWRLFRKISAASFSEIFKRQRTSAAMAPGSKSSVSTLNLPSRNVANSLTMTRIISGLERISQHLLRDNHPGNGTAQTRSSSQQMG